MVVSVVLWVVVSVSHLLPPADVGNTPHARLVLSTTARGSPTGAQPTLVLRIATLLILMITLNNVAS